VGSVDLRVTSARGGGEALPLRTINRLEEGDSVLYRPLLRSGEQRKGDVALVLVPVNRAAAGEKLLVLEPKPADQSQEWRVPWRVAVVAFVYGPSGLDTKKVRNFLSRDEELVAQLADYAEKTAQTEALIAALASPNTSAAAVQSALQGFSSQYGLNVQLDRNATPNQQAMTLFRTLNPAIASYDPISPQMSQQVGQAASLAASVATLFFGSPVGLAAGGTAMLLELRSVAFPKAEFRSSFSQTLPGDGLGLCGRRDPAAPHTRVAYLWATRVPNAGPPQLSVDKANSLPGGLKSPLTVNVSEPDWKVVDRARNWVLLSETGKPLPVSVQKLADIKSLEVDLTHVKPGRYGLAANWDWDRFQVKGTVEVRPLADFSSTRPVAASQDLLVARTGKVPVTMEGSDFEFVIKVEIEKVDDKFATPASVPFILPDGLRRGPQEKMDVQINSIDLDPGRYKLLLTQVDGKPHAVDLKILPAPPTIENLPVILNQGASHIEFRLKGKRLDLLNRIEVAHGKAELRAANGDQAERILTLTMAPEIAAGTSLSAKGYIQDRSEPLTFTDAVRIVGPLPQISEVRVSQPADQDVQLEPGELPGGMYLSAMIRAQHLQSNSLVRLGCEQPGFGTVTLRLGERTGALSLQQIAPDQLFLSFDSSAWLNGCLLRVTVANGREGESAGYSLGRIIRVPRIERFERVMDSIDDGGYHAMLTGQNLETIERVGWTPDSGEAVTALPLPIAGEASKQTLEVKLAPAGDPPGTLWVWLRGQSTARATRVRP
jgi:hypothetical protein